MTEPERSRSGNVDLRLYALVDPERAGGHALPELAWLVAAGGATLVQLRDKHGETRAMVEAARAIRANLKPMRVPLLINDRVDVALAAQAEGVHVGQEDMAVADARRLLGPRAIIGLSIKTPAQAEAATITGSSTTLLCRQRSRPAATASITAGCESMPIFTALTSRSENTASIWAAMKSPGTSWMAVTPLVFCAVSAVTTQAP